MHQNYAVPMEDGSWVTQEMLNTVNAIYEFFPDIEVMWIPRDKREENDPVFCLIDRRTRDVVMYVDKEENFNQLLLQRLHMADRTKYTYEDSIKHLNKSGG